MAVNILDVEFFMRFYIFIKPSYRVYKVGLLVVIYQFLTRTVKKFFRVAVSG